MKKAIVVKVIEADEGTETKRTDYTLSMDEMTDSLIEQISDDAGVDLGLHDMSIEIIHFNFIIDRNVYIDTN